MTIADLKEAKGPAMPGRRVAPTGLRAWPDHARPFADDPPLWLK
jgi:hypothetical protein